MTDSIAFPHLGILLAHVGRSVDVFGFEIAYYGIVIALAMMAGLSLAMWTAKKTGQDPDDYFNLAMVAIVVGLICARLYYVAFSWEYYRENPLQIFNFRGGGLAIYGGVIGGVASCLVYARVKKLKRGLALDTACVGLVLGQSIGRWGNFFNREAFGGYTDNLLAMRLPLDAVRTSEVTEEMTAHLVEVDGISYIQVHPTFLYESLWNLGVLAVLLAVTLRGAKKFHGEIFLLYLLLYGLGRLWIEGLRTDQLLIPGTAIPVSQLLSGILAVLSLALILALRARAGRRGRKNDGE